MSYFFYEHLLWSFCLLFFYFNVSFYNICICMKKETNKLIFSQVWLNARAVWTIMRVSESIITTYSILAELTLCDELRICVFIMHSVSCINQVCVRLLEVSGSGVCLDSSRIGSFTVRSEGKLHLGHTDTLESRREETLINLFHSSRWRDWAKESLARDPWTDIRGKPAISR